MLPDTMFAEFARLVSKSPVFLLRSRRDCGKHSARWNLIVPPQVPECAFEEVSRAIDRKRLA
jgi:hypothetical protein